MHPLDGRWAQVLAATPRERFVPDVVWVRDGAGGYRRLDRAAEPGAWDAAVRSDGPLVTGFTDLEGEPVPASSLSAPSTVVRMLTDARLAADSRVLEIGTGSGFNTALLCAGCPDGLVVTLDDAPAFSEGARRVLRSLGHDPVVITADGTAGLPGPGPYSHVLATCSVRAVPRAWLAQTRAGGRIVTPWDASWLCYGTLVLDKAEDGSAAGWFAPYGSYMLISTQRVAPEAFRDAADGPAAECTSTGLSPWEVAGEGLDVQFHLGLSLPGVRYDWDTSGERAPLRLLVWEERGAGRAVVEWDGEQSERFAVRQYGARRLWDEVVAAYAWWVRAGRPGVGRYGLSVLPDGRQWAWLDAPETAVLGSVRWDR